MKVNGDPEEHFLLQLMKIPSIDPNQSHEAVPWDTACKGKFVRQKLAQRMNFPFKEKRLRVTTLGGNIQEIDSVIYSCKVKDQRGKIC